MMDSASRLELSVAQACVFLSANDLSRLLNFQSIRILSQRGTFGGGHGLLTVEAGAGWNGDNLDSKLCTSVHWSDGTKQMVSMPQELSWLKWSAGVVQELKPSVEKAGEIYHSVEHAVVVSRSKSLIKASMDYANICAGAGEQRLLLTRVCYAYSPYPV